MPKLTDKQRMFVESYLQCWNATEAARRAGYEGDANVLAVTGHDNLRNPKISEFVSMRISEAAMSADEVLKRLARYARGSLKPFMTQGGDTLWPDLGTSEALENIDLLKKIKPKRRTGGRDENQWTEDEIELELHDPMRALELIGKHHKLFTEKTEVTGKDGGPIQHEDSGMSDSERAKRIAAILERARQNSS